MKTKRVKITSLIFLNNRLYKAVILYLSYFKFKVKFELV